MNNYSYSILRFEYSKILEERINLGILLYSPTEGRVEFLFPTSLKRISHLYADFALVDLRKYLSIFNKQAKKLNKILEESTKQINFIEEISLHELISQYFLVEDSNSLSFSDSITVEGGGDFNAFSNFLFKSYFSFYQNDKPQIRKDEEYISNIFSKKFDTISNSNEIKNQLRKDVKLGEEQFEYVWQNGSLNHIKPLSFDYSDSHYIKNKSYYWHTALEFILQDLKDKSNEFRFDFLITRPSKRELFKEYDKALNILSDLSTSVKLVEEEDIGNYVESIGHYFNRKDLF